MASTLDFGGASRGRYTVSLIWRIAIVAVLAIGLLTDTHKVSFFTSQSAIFALAYFVCVVYAMVARRQADAVAPRLRGGVTLWLLTTFLVSHFINKDGENPLPGLSAATTPEELLANRSIFLLHYIAPVMVLADFLLLSPRGATRWRDLPLWMLFPAFFVVTSIARAVLMPESADRYPYGFLDPSVQGYGMVAVRVLLIGLAIAALGAGLVLADTARARLMARGAFSPLVSPEAPTRDGADVREEVAAPRTE